MLALAPTLVTPPSTTPVTLAEVKAHLRVEHSEDDTLIAAYLAAAVSHLDGWSGILGRCLMTQVWRFDFERFPCGRVLHLGFPDLREADGDDATVTYLDGAEESQMLSAVDYVIANTARGAALVLASGASWPATAAHPAAVSVTATFGYPSAAFPAAIKAAILLMVGDLYRNRETAVTGVTAAPIPMSTTVENLLAPHRCGFFA